jgi:hypothetical protein
MGLLGLTGADAVSVDQTNDLALIASVLRDTMLFGNLDPVNTLRHGDPAEITESVNRAKEAGADAVWPGCDLVPKPLDNTSIRMDASEKLRAVNKITSKKSGPKKTTSKLAMLEQQLARREAELDIINYHPARTRRRAGLPGNCGSGRR